jgi:PAS domain S-box-containing protein
MDSPARAEILQALQDRRQTIAAEWCRAIARTSYVPLPITELQQRLADLVGQAIDLLVGEPLDIASAEALGETLANLHYLQPEALSRTIAVLGRHLASDLPASDAQALYPNLMALLEGVSTGFSRQGLQTVLREQEGIRRALLTELRKTEFALRRAHDEMEERVEERTKQLALINEQLRIEIAERKRVEAVLRRSQEGLQSVLLALHETFVAVYDRDGRHAHVWGPADLETRYGIDYQDVIGMPVTDLFPGTEAERVFADIRHVFERGEPVRTEIVVDYPNGEFWHDVSLSPVHNAAGEVEAVVAFVRDITQRKKVEQALRDSEEKYRELVENISDVVYVVGMDGVITYVSPAIQPVLGYMPEEMIGQKLQTFVHPDSLSRAGQALKQILNGEYTDNEYLFRTKSGEARWVRTASRPILDGRRMLGVRGIVADITARKRAEEALRESEARYRLLLETVRDGVYTLDTEGRFTFVNDVIIQRSGRSREWFLGRSHLDTVRPEDREVMRERVEAVLRGESVPNYELAIRAASGELFWVELNTTALREGDRIVGLHGVSRDITERHRAREALRESEQMWRSLAESAPDLVLTADRERRILFMNRTPPGSDWTVENVIGQDLLDFALPEHRLLVKAAIDRVLKGEGNEYLEAVAVRADGAHLWYATHIGPIQRNGDIAELMLIVRDVTERRRVEEIKDNLIRDVSHELRTPLAKTQMSLEYLHELLQRETIDPERVARIGEMARRNVQRLLHTVEGIMDLSAVSATVPDSVTATVSLGALIDDVVQDMRSLAVAQGLALRVDLPPALPPVRGDADKLFRVLTNLIDNAIKFSERGEIVVTGQVRGREVEISVSDSGLGIQFENLERVFERFYQEKSRFPGIGVGLTICQAIIERYGGKIWAESAGRGQGATLRFTLPRIEE